MSQRYHDEVAILIRMPRTLRDQLTAAARRHDRSTASLLRTIVREFVAIEQQAGPR